jgi:hypothetical protein
MAELAQKAYALGGPFLKIALQAFVLQKAISFLSGGFGTLFQTLPGIGEVLFLLTGRSNGLINTFATLSKQIGLGGAGFLLLGKHLNAIPPLAALVASRMGPFGGILAGLLPQVAGLGIQFAGLTRIVPGLDQVFFKLTKQMPGLIGQIAQTVATSNIAGGAFRNLAPAIQQVASSVSIYASNIDNATFINAKFADAAKLAGAMARQQLISFGLLGAGVFAAFYIFDNFILKNKGLLQTLQAIGNVAKTVGKAIYDFMTNPFVVATGVIFGLGVAIRAGLIPVVLDLVKTFAGRATVAIADWAMQATKSLRSFSQGIRDTSAEVAGFFGRKQQAMAKDTDAFAAQLKNQAAEYKQALADRRAQLEAVNNQKARVDPVRNSAQFQDLTQQQKAIQQEIDGMFAARKAQGTDLAARKRDLAQIEQQVAKTATPVQRLRGTFEQLGGTITRVSGDAVMGLGKNLGAIGFDRLGQQAYTAGAGIFEMGGNMLKADTAQKGLLKSTALSQISVQRLQGTMTQLSGTFTRFGGDAVMSLGKALGNVGLDRFGKQAYNAGAGMFELGSQTLKSDKAQKGFLNSTQLTALNMKNLQAAASVAGKGMASAFTMVGKALGTLAVEFGPILLLTAAIATVTEAIGLYTKLTESSKNAVSSYNDAVSETTQKLSTLEAQLTATATSTQALNDSVATYIEKRLEDLEKNASWLSKLADFSQNLNVFNAVQGDKGTNFVEEEAQARLADEGKAFDITMRQADEYRDKLRSNWSQAVAQEQELADLRNKQAEATAAGNDEEARRLGNQIKLREDITQARKEDVDAQIAYLEKQNPINARQKEDLAAQLQLLKAIRTELEEIPNTQITPPDLPRLGTTMEQLGSKAQAALDFIAKGVGTSEQATQKAEELFEVTDAQVKLGQISGEEAVRRYQQLANNANVSAEIQIKAQDAIATARQQASERITESVDREKAEVELAAANETIGEAEKQRQLLEIEGEGLARRLEQLRADKAERDRIRAEELQSSLALIDAQIGEAQSKLNSGDLNTVDTEATRKQIESLRQQRGQIESASNAAQLADSRRTANEEQQILTQQAANAAQIRQQEREQTLKDFDEAQTQLQGRRAEGLLSDEAYNQAALDITQARLDEELAIIQEQRESLDPNDTEGLEELATREAAIYQKRREARDRFFQDQRSAVQQDSQEQQSIIDGQQAEGLLTQEQYAQASIDLTVARLDQELELVRQQRSQLAATDIEGQEKLAAAEAEILQQRRQAQDKFFDQLRSAASEDAKERQTILDGEKALGRVSQEDYAQQSLDLTLEQLDEEARIVEQERAKISATDIEGQERLAAAEADIARRRVEAQQKFYDRQLELAEQARRKLLDATKAAETQREIDIQEQLNSGSIRSSEADQLKLESAAATAQAELEIEEQKLAELEAMPRFSDPDAEEKRQQEIRNSRQRTSDITLTLAENEYQQQQQFRQRMEARIDRQALAAQNESQAKVFGLEEEQRRVDAISRTYEQQNKILEARRSLLDANVGVLNAQLKALSETTNNDAQRKDINQITAVIQLNTLNQRQEMERRITELNHEQQRIALEREQTEIRIAQIRNVADTGQAIADLAKVEADPEASSEQIEASRMGLAATLFEGRALQDQLMLLQQQGVAQEQLNRAELTVLSQNQQSERINTQMELINTLDPGDRRQAQRAMQQQMLGRLGLGQMSDIGRVSEAMTDGALQRMFPGNRNFMNGMPSGVPLGRFMPSAPQITLPGIPSLTAQPVSPMLPASMRESPQVIEAMTGLQDMLQSLGTIQFSQTNEINNNFSPADVDAGRVRDKANQQQNQAMYNLARQLEARQR